MLGHTWANEDNPNFRCREFQVLIARGVEWAATGKSPSPRDEPVESEVGHSVARSETIAVCRLSLRPGFSDLSNSLP